MSYIPAVAVGVIIVGGVALMRPKAIGKSLIDALKSVCRGVGKNS